MMVKVGEGVGEREGVRDGDNEGEAVVEDAVPEALPNLYTTPPAATTISLLAARAGLPRIGLGRESFHSCEPLLFSASTLPLTPPLLVPTTN